MDIEGREGSQPEGDEFNPLSEEEMREREEAEEFRRRVRREILRVQSGEADEEIARDREEEEARQREEQEREQRAARKRSRLFWQIFSGNILVNRSVAENYRYFVAIAGMCFVSIVVMFASLAADMKYSRMEREVQLLRERSIRLQEQLYRRTTHAAISEELQRRGISLQDPRRPKAVVEE